MGRGIIKVRDLYCEWGTIVDAPVSRGYMFDQAVLRWGEDRVIRAKENGHSYRDMGPDHRYWEQNRAGPNETCLDEEALYESLKISEEDKRLEKGYKFTTGACIDAIRTSDLPIHIQVYLEELVKERAKSP